MTRTTIMSRIGILALLASGLACAQELPKNLVQLLNALKNDQSGQMATMAEAVLGKDGGNQLFYFPTHDEPCTPRQFGLAYEDIHFLTADGIKLHGWFLPVQKKQKAKGTIIFSHGNSGSVAYYLGLVDWLAKAGYQVMMYDYRGFGKSAGTPTREGLVKDVEAAFAYAAKRPDTLHNKLISFSHSLGGATSIVALARRPVPGLRAVITEGAFASYQGMATTMAGDVGKRLVSDELAPHEVVAKLPAPLLMIHGSDDPVVPIAQGRQLFAAANSRKTFFEVKGGHHGDSLSRNGGEYRKKVLQWLDRCLEQS